MASLLGVLQDIEKAPLRRAEREYLRRVAVEKMVSGGNGAKLERDQTSADTCDARLKRITHELGSNANNILLTAENLRLALVAATGRHRATLHAAINEARLHGPFLDDQLLKDLFALNHAATGIRHMDKPMLGSLCGRMQAVFEGKAAGHKGKQVTQHAGGTELNEEQEADGNAEVDKKNKGQAENMQQADDKTHDDGNSDMPPLKSALGRWAELQVQTEENKRPEDAGTHDVDTEQENEVLIQTACATVTRLENAREAVQESARKVEQLTLRLMTLEGEYNSSDSSNGEDANEEATKKTPREQKRLSNKFYLGPKHLSYQTGFLRPQQLARQRVDAAFCCMF